MVDKPTPPSITSVPPHDIVSAEPLSPWTLNVVDMVFKLAVVILPVSSIVIVGDDSSVITVGGSNDTLQLLGGRNISNTSVVGADSITFNLNNNLTDIHSITNSSTNADLELSTNGSGSVVINDILSFSANRSGDPTATAITRLWTQTPGGGGTGVYFNNTSVSSGTAGELISKSKATALAIALG